MQQLEALTREAAALGANEPAHERPTTMRPSRRSRA